MALLWVCVCLRVCTCVYVWQGLNRQQLPQGKVYSVDMLLKQNFPIPANQSRYIYDEHVVLQDTAPHVRQANNLYRQAPVTGFLSKAQCFLSNKTLSLPHTRQTDNHSALSLTERLSLAAS